MAVTQDEQTVHAVVRELLAPLLPLERGSPTGWHLAGWDAEQGVNLTLKRGGASLLVELEPLDPMRDCYARTARFNVCARRAFDARAQLSDLERRVVDQVCRILRERERLLPEYERPQTSSRSEVRELRVQRVLVPEGGGHYYVNPYVGCMLGCEYCYVAARADFSRRLEGLPSLPWGRWVGVKTNAGQVLREELKRHAPGIVRMSPILTEPYQPLERTYRVTRACLEALVGTGFVPAILTRCARVTEDLELLQRFPVAAVGFSIPTDDDLMRQRFEPGADPIEERLEALERCHRAGLRTFVLVQPMLPMDAARLAKRVAPFVQAVRIDRMHDIERVRHLYEAAGCLEAATDEFFARTQAQLVREFAARGVAMDELDDLGAALGLVPGR